MERADPQADLTRDREVPEAAEQIFKCSAYYLSNENVAGFEFLRLMVTKGLGK
jgi:hypothetical protein